MRIQAPVILKIHGLPLVDSVHVGQPLKGVKQYLLMFNQTISKMSTFYGENKRALPLASKNENYVR